MSESDLRERVAHAMWHQGVDAAIAIVLEEAARVCDPKGDCSEMDAYGKGYAAAIRALAKGDTQPVAPLDPELAAVWEANTDKLYEP